MTGTWKLIGLFAATFAAAQDGTCVAGVDPMGQVQECLGRCHVYVENSYGACGDLITSSHITRDCGDSPQNACISTFNAAWDGSKGNCGNCYYVEMDYEDGTTTSVYLKTIDTNASETKFEMMQYAWEKLCPYVCLGYGNCAHQASDCPLGIIEANAGFPASCNVQYNQVRFKRVSCDGSGNDNNNNNGGSSGGNGGSSGGSKTTTKRPSHQKTTTTRRPSHQKTSTTRRPWQQKTTTTTKRPGRVTTTKETSYNAVVECQQIFGRSSRDVFAKDCLTKCTFYNEHPHFCGSSERLSGKELASCVSALTGYCEQ